MQSVFIETSIFGYLASRTSGDLIVAGNQRLTYRQSVTSAWN